MPSLGACFVSTTVGPTTNNYPIWALVTAASETLCITELQILGGQEAGTAVAIGITIQTAAFVSATQQNYDVVQRILIEDGSADIVPSTIWVPSFRQFLTVTAGKYYRRAIYQVGGASPSQPSGMLFKFPRGLVIPGSFAVVAWVTSSSGNQPVQPQFYVNVRADG